MVRVLNITSHEILLIDAKKNPYYILSKLVKYCSEYCRTSDASNHSKMFCDKIASWRHAAKESHMYEEIEEVGNSFVVDGSKEDAGVNEEDVTSNSRAEYDCVPVKYYDV